MIRTLQQLFVQRGMPRGIRSDNGSEFIAAAIRTWLAASGVETLYIEPGAPWENGRTESFHGKLRDEFLNGELLASALAAKMLTEAYRMEFNQQRPHSALGYQTPAAFAAGLGGSAPKLPPGARPLDPGFFPSAEKEKPDSQSNLTLIRTGR